MCEVLAHSKPGVERSDILDRLSLESKKFMLVSMHRAENVDIRDHLTALLDVINSLCVQYGFPVIVSTHPRTRQRLNSLGYPCHEHVQFLKPFGYFDYVRLQIDAMCTLSDSGTISEESSMLGFPAVTMRTAMERPEAMDSGHIVLTGLDPDTIRQSIEYVVASQQQSQQHRIASEYEVRNTSHRVLKLILGTAKLGHLWDGIIAA
jgi:UDP-N-acetylglucosamine 2-epimerase (non-hydrolysing)